MSNVYNAAERRHVREAQKDAKRTDKESEEIIRGIMSLPAGRSWILRKLESCHVFASSFGTNALNTAFAEGERNIGLQLLNDIMAACPDQYVRMMQERNTREEAAVMRREPKEVDEAAAYHGVPVNTVEDLEDTDA